MSTLGARFIAAIVLNSIIATGSHAAYCEKSKSTPCCDLITQALKDVAAIRVGSKRSDVERKFSESAGLSFGTKTVFVYKKCHLLQVTVTFVPAVGKPEGTDTVESVSSLFVAYEAKD